MTIAVLGGSRFDTESGQYVSDSRIVIDGGSFTEVGSGNEPTPSDGASTIDASNMFVYPGFFNTHAHMSIMYRVGILEEYFTKPLHELAMHMGRVAPALLAQGITTVRDMGGPGDLHLVAKQAVGRNEVLGPRILACGQPLTSTGGHGWQLAYEADGADGFLAAAREQLKRGADFIKVMASDDPWMMGAGAEYTRRGATDEELRAAFGEAHRWGKFAGCHVKGSDAIRAVLDAGADIIDHGTYLTTELAQQMAERGIFYTPTLSAHVQSLHPRYRRTDRIKWYGEHADAHASLMAGRRAAMDAALEAGVKLLVGTDTVGAYAEELKLMRKAGVTAVDTMRACTSWAAAALRLDDTLGSITVGKTADLVILGSDPLADPAAVEDVRHVIKDGQAYLPSSLMYAENFLQDSLLEYIKMPVDAQ